MLVVLHKSAIFRGLNTLSLYIWVLKPQTKGKKLRELCTYALRLRSIELFCSVIFIFLYYIRITLHFRIELFSKIICSGILEQWYSLLCYLLIPSLLCRHQNIFKALFEIFGGNLRGFTVLNSFSQEIDFLLNSFYKDRWKEANLIDSQFIDWNSCVFQTSFKALDILGLGNLSTENISIITSKI